MADRSSHSPRGADCGNPRYRGTSRLRRRRSSGWRTFASAIRSRWTQSRWCDNVSKTARSSTRWRYQKRWRTIDPGRQVVLVILVREHPAGAGGLLGHLTRALGQPMILPILDYSDGYGRTYGGRISPPEMLGAETHTSIPLTWGATRQAAIEVGRRFERGPLTYASATVAIRERENPHYKEDDTRRIVGARVERRLASWLLAGASSGWTDVGFATLDQRFVAWGADIAFDTRKSLELPRNAAYVQAGWGVTRLRRRAVRAPVPNRCARLCGAGRCSRARRARRPGQHV